MEREVFENTLKFAIENEVRSNEFYSDAATKLKDQRLKDLFTELAGEERKHRQILEEFIKAGPTAFHFDLFPDYKVAETVEDIQMPSTNMKPPDAIALAMKKEQEAMALYEAMANACGDPEQRKLLQELASMERQHKFKMENMFTEVAYPEAW